jgi:hypothetical protein
MVAIAFSPQATRSATIVHDWAQKIVPETDKSTYN